MKKLLCIFTTTILAILFTFICFAHPGRTDANGGHYNHKTGEYHYHNGNSGYSDYLYDSETTTRKSFDEIMSERNENSTNLDLFSHDVTLGYYEEVDSHGSAKIEKEETTSDFTSTSNNQHSFIENFLFAVFFGFITAYFVVIVLSNIFKNSTTLWWISAIIAFVITVILYMLNKSQ